MACVLFLMCTEENNMIEAYFIIWEVRLPLYFMKPAVLFLLSTADQVMSQDWLVPVTQLYLEVRAPAKHGLCISSTYYDFFIYS